MATGAFCLGIIAVVLLTAGDAGRGKEVSAFVARHMPEEIACVLDHGDLGMALERAFLSMDEMLEDTKYSAELLEYKAAGQLPAEGDGGGASESGRGACGGGRGRGVSGRGRGGGRRGGDLIGGMEEDEAIEMFKKVMAMKRAGAGRGGGRGRGAFPGAPASGAAGSEAQMCTLDDHRVQAGCTAVVGLVRGNELVVANAGDSRAVLSRAGCAIPLSFDHKPSDQAERDRVYAAGGFIREANGHHRINGNLNLSRSIGDLKYKQNKRVSPSEQIITAQPDITRHEVEAEDEFMVIACDGIWDIMSNQEAIDFVRPRLTSGVKPSKIAEEMMDFCICDDPKKVGGLGGDNMTAVIVQFKR